MNKIIEWVKRKLGITALWEENKKLRKELSYHRQFVISKMKELKDYSRVDADIGYRGNNTIVLTGVYRNTAYVKFYDMGDAEFKLIIEKLQDMRKHSLIRHIDKPYNFHGIFEL